MHNISWFHRLFVSVGNAVKILLRWATWCRRAFVIVMPKRGKKGAVAEDGEEPKTGKKINERLSLEAAMGEGDASNFMDRRKVRTNALHFCSL